MNLLVRFVLRHTWAQMALAAAVAFAIWSRPRLSSVLWGLGALYTFLAFACALAGWWPGVGVSVVGVGLSGLCIRRMARAAAELERLVDGWRAGEAP